MVDTKPENSVVESDETTVPTHPCTRSQGLAAQINAHRSGYVDNLQHWIHKGLRHLMAFLDSKNVVHI